MFCKTDHFPNLMSNFTPKLVSFDFLYIFFILLIYSCKSDAELAIERGIQFYDWGKFSEALVEFNKSKFFQLRQRNQAYKDLKLLAQTHYNLAITYAKINMYQKITFFSIFEHVCRIIFAVSPRVELPRGLR
mgnify:CR=1 FL=1